MASHVFESMFSSPHIGTDVSPPVINLAENSAVLANLLTVSIELRSLSDFVTTIMIANKSSWTWSTPIIPVLAHFSVCWKYRRACTVAALSTVQGEKPSWASKEQNWWEQTFHCACKPICVYNQPLSVFIVLYATRRIAVVVSKVVIDMICRKIPRLSVLCFWAVRVRYPPGTRS